MYIGYWPVDMYNEPYQVDYIKPDGKYLQYKNGKQHIFFGYVVNVLNIF